MAGCPPREPLAAGPWAPDDPAWPWSSLFTKPLGFLSSIPHRQPHTQDDESLKYLTHEEKDVILFFEETIDSLEDDCEEQALCDSGVHCHSPQSLEGSTSSPSEPEEVIDLVPPGPAAGGPESVPDVPEAAGEDRNVQGHPPSDLAR